MNLLRRYVYLRIIYKLSVVRLLCLSLVILVFLNEFLIYRLYTLFWASLDDSGSDSVRVLFVADPQLIGMEDELPHYPLISYITRWDSDRYLSKTFNLAMTHHRPDVVVFMGDLFDEGTKPSYRNYVSYKRRFNAIFNSTYHVKHVYIPGDNDVGGEGSDLIEQWKLDRFADHFSATRGISTVRFVDFLRIHYTSGYTMQAKLQRLYTELASRSLNHVRVLVNHMGLLGTSSGYNQKILHTFRPSIIFTAHTHIATFSTCVDCYKEAGRTLDTWRPATSRINNYNVYEFHTDFKDVVSEIVIPTCSYRMGVPNIGYGAAVIERSKKSSFTVLWTPSRYRHLYLYLLTLVISFSIMCIKAVMACFHFR